VLLVTLPLIRRDYRAAEMEAAMNIANPTAVKVPEFAVVIEW
jgi:hypothetical protein